MIRLSVSVSDEVNVKLNAMANKWGVSKSNLCAMVLGQYVDELFKVDEAALIKKAKNNNDDLKGQIEIEEIIPDVKK